MNYKTLIPVRILRKSTPTLVYVPPQNFKFESCFDTTLPNGERVKFHLTRFLGGSRLIAYNGDATPYHVTPKVLKRLYAGESFAQIFYEGVVSEL